MNRIILLSCLLAVASAVSLSDFSEEEIIHGNKFIDDLLDDMMEENGDYYDPYPIGDRVIGFYRKVLFVNVSGEAKLFNGHITGLRTVHRAEDCTLKREEDRIRVRAQLGAGILNLNYSGAVKFMTLGPTITVHGVMAYVEITMEFTVDGSTGKNGVLEEFYADDMRGMVIKITGLGPFNWILNTLIKAVTAIFGSYIKSILESQVEKHIAERIREYEFPVIPDVTSNPKVM